MWSPAVHTFNIAVTAVLLDTWRLWFRTLLCEVPVRQSVGELWTAVLKSLFFFCLCLAHSLLSCYLVFAEWNVALEFRLFVNSKCILQFFVFKVFNITFLIVFILTRGTLYLQIYPRLHQYWPYMLFGISLNPSCWIYLTICSEFNLQLILFFKPLQPCIRLWL